MIVLIIIQSVMIIILGVSLYLSNREAILWRESANAYKKAYKDMEKACNIYRNLSNGLWAHEIQEVKE